MSLTRTTPGARASHARSLDEVKRNPGLFNAAGNPRITLRSIQATLPDGRDSLPVKFAEAFGFGRA